MRFHFPPAAFGILQSRLFRCLGAPQCAKGGGVGLPGLSRMASGLFEYIRFGAGRAVAIAITTAAGSQGKEQRSPYGGVHRPVLAVFRQSVVASTD